MTRMQPPPFLLALGLLFWGYYSGFEVAGALMAVVVEGHRWLRIRWELDAREFERVADLCTIAFASALMFQFVQARHFPESLVSALVWLPMLFFALILVQRYSVQASVPLSALFWSLRRRGERNDARIERMPLDYAYFFACGLAAASANPRSYWFFASLCALAVYALWPAAPRRRRRTAWALAFALATALGFGLQAGLTRAQSSFEEWVFEWLAHRWTSPPDPYRTRTAIGDIGEVKASDRIVLRVDARGARAPTRLRSASYNVYALGSWMSPGQAFMPVPTTGQRWELGSGNGRRARLSAWFNNESPLLALPSGTYRLDGLDVGSVQRSVLGAVRIDQGPDLLQFDAYFDDAVIADAPPTTADLTIPPSQMPALEQVAAEISLPENDPHAAARAIAEFFDSRFAYTLALSGPDHRPRSLAAFLLTDRRGHCEYFATATALLLRRAGIPSRYITGYAVQEWSPLEAQYIVRARHAHAWAMAWIDGGWQELDTTPAVWAETEEQRASPLQPLYDLLSLVNFRLRLWQRAGPEAGSGPGLMLWAAGALAGYLGWRIWRRRRVRHPARAPAAAGNASAPTDQRIAALLKRLATLGYVRPPGAPLLRWADALQLPDPNARVLLRHALERYYRARFDPCGLPAEEDRFLGEQADELLRQLQSPAPSHSGVA